MPRKEKVGIEEKHKLVLACISKKMGVCEAGGSLLEICKEYKIRSTRQLRNRIKVYHAHEDSYYTLTAQALDPDTDYYCYRYRVFRVSADKASGAEKETYDNPIIQADSETYIEYLGQKMSLKEYYEGIAQVDPESIDGSNFFKLRDLGAALGFDIVRVG